ncbi:MAG: molybdopterin-dependent oxidoreductase, partial [Gammaproteobacteria bacterium]|nr:molybdopterin-dependent oxidoreductase [Gammaproteobacteria bacterium]
DIVPDERLLADDRLNFIGKPIALVLAETAAQARAAAAKVQLDYTELPAILDVAQAYAQGHTFGPPRRLVKGDPAQAFQQARWIAERQVETPAQEHLYFETQAALAIPQDGDRLHLYCTSQNPSGIQRFAARVLNRPMHAIHVEVPRLGGAFGGKEEQTKPWALLAALGAALTGRPVRLVLNRPEDLHWTGKRHPYRIHYRLGADADGRLLAYDVLFLQDGGAVADLSTAVLERTLFHATNAYAIEHTDSRAVSCRTHHPSNTAFRGFGAPQAILALECALDQLSRISGRPRWQLQATNLVAPGYAFPYGMVLDSQAVHTCWHHLWESRQIQARLQAIEQHNQREPRQRRALALTPLCFGIAFTATHLNQGCATVNVYTDGSVGIAISAVEMGQGLFEKVRAIASRCFELPLERIRVDFTHTARTPNMPPTAASVCTDLSGIATLQACTDLRERLRAFAATRLGLDPACVELQGGVFRASNDLTGGVTWDALV